ncbi:MAG TPA: PrpF domain-containing protein [Pseudolabrys sp.]|uniref:PrpF domain-containing protein n=1 Tax=Pseudolabrys sp. TaxID=1960880 RepID=UPI002DDD2C1D|nr:PrpF domain-containing protein [Pseudolabrys sp.]HEV2629758.1 PrpF domain-containing protein [Pseudolabrys sp.]
MVARVKARSYGPRRWIKPQERPINYAAPLPADRLPRERFGTWEFPVMHARGGTSTGLVIWDRVAPQELHLREELLRHLMGLPLEGTTNDAKQITGLGRGYPTSNKVFFAEMKRTASGAPQIVSTLAQLASGKAAIDWSVNCGNMSASLPYWAIDQQFLPRDLNGAGEVEIYNTNTKSTMIARVALDGDGFAFASIPGVDGAFPGVDLFLTNPVGAKTGKALPTGAPADQIGKYLVSCVDVAVPMVIARASDFGKTGTEPVKELRGDEKFFSALKALWIEAGLKMGLKRKDGTPMSADELANSETIPKVCIISPPVNGGHISTRYFTPQEGHATMAVTGGCCLAAACLMPGTVAHAIARGLPSLGAETSEIQVDIENPAGILSATIGGRRVDQTTTIERAAYKRSAQVLLRGYAPLYRASPELKKALAAIAANPALALSA